MVKQVYTGILHWRPELSDVEADAATNNGADVVVHNNPVIPMRTAAATISLPGTLVRHKSWLILVANAYQELLEESEHVISFRTLMARLDWDASTSIKRLKQDIEALAQTTVRFNMLGADNDDDWSSIHQLIAEAVDDGMGNIRYSFPPRLRRKLADPSVFSLLALDALNLFSSKYALALYLILNQFARDGETPEISVHAYRQMMNVEEGEYTEFKRLKPRVITEPLAEVSTKSDLEAEVIFVKDGKTIIKLQFVNIRRKPDHHLTTILQAHSRPSVTIEAQAVDSVDEAATVCNEISSHQNYQSLLINQYSVDAGAVGKIVQAVEDGVPESIIRAALDRVDAYRSTQNVKNIGAYTSRTVLNAVQSYREAMGVRATPATVSRARKEEADHRQRYLEKFRNEYVALTNRRLEGAYESLPIERKTRLTEEVSGKIPSAFRKQLDPAKPIYSLNPPVRAFFLTALRDTKEMQPYLVTEEIFLRHLAGQGFEVDVLAPLIADVLSS